MYVNIYIYIYIYIYILEKIKEHCVQYICPAPANVV